MRVRALSALVVASVLALLSAPGARSSPPATAIETALPAEILERLGWSDDPGYLASLLRVRALDGRSPGALAAPAGRRATRLRRPRHPEPLPPLSDTAIAADPVLTEQRPDVAANPARSRLVTAAYAGFVYPTAPARRCAVVRSRDKGLTWSPAVSLPLLDPASGCNDPVLAWSPNGKHLYAAYRDFKSGTTTLEPPPEGGTRFRVFANDDVVVSRSDDGGLNWSAPVVALDADPWAYTVTCRPGVFPCDITDVDPGSSYERPALATPLDGGGGKVYATATCFAEQDPGAPPTAIAFARSDDAGRTWSAPETLDTGAGDPQPILVQGASVAGGWGNEVLVAWYHSGDDGHLVGGFEIRVRRSRFNGRVWDPVVTAARDASETSRDLGPLDFYKQWWPTMFPDLGIDERGRAHIVYGHDPEPGHLTAEEGDIRYVTSHRTPWTDWSSPLTLNDDGPGRAQGFASLTLHRRGRASAADVVWEDTRLSPELPVDPATFLSPNAYYDIFHARWTCGRGAGRWSANRRVSDASSLQDRAMSGRRTSVTVNDLVVFAAWTDRRGVSSVTDRSQDVFGSRIAP
jgi:hypothetical protein